MQQQLEQRCRGPEFWIRGEILQFVWVRIVVVKFDAVLAMIPFRVPPILGAKTSTDDLIVGTPSNNLSSCGFRPFRNRAFD